MKIYLIFLLILSVTAQEWINLYHSDENIKIDFTVALKQNMQAIKKLEHLVLEDLSNIDSPNYGNYLTMEEINNLVSPPQQQKDRVIQWLHENDITNIIDLGDVLKCSSSIRTIDQTFNTKFELYINRIKKIYIHRSSKPYEIPHHLKDIIDFVDGLSNKLYPVARSKINYPSKDNVDPNMISREVLMRVYNAYPGYTTKNVSVGAMEYLSSEGFNKDDLRFTQIANGVPSNPIKNIIGKNYYIGTEGELDVQVMWLANANSTLWFDGSRLWLYSWAVNYANLNSTPQVASISWGWNEFEQCSIEPCNNITSAQYVKRTSNEFLKIVATGRTIVVASGDAGSPGRTNEICTSDKKSYGYTNMNAVFPASSPWVLTVGATYLVKSTGSFEYKTPICNDYHDQNMYCASGTEEQSTTYDKTEWTSGSGFSRIFPRQPWQTQEVDDYLKNNITFPDQKYWDQYGRAYPDISAFGHNCAVSMGGTWLAVDGTSCASPIIAGIITNINQYQLSRNKPLVGFVNPLLYKINSFYQDTFNDITVGNSACTEAKCCGSQFGFTAAPGWDVVSGVGTPNLEKIIKYLSIFN